jgi:heat shock protein HslJ
VPGVGDPTFFPKRESPPPVRVELLEQVVDGAGTVQGWLSYTRGGPNDPGPRLRGAWRLEKLGERDVVGTVKPPLMFTSDGSLRGETGCNRINGKFEVAGDALKIGRLATTRRACAKPMMEQERQVLDSLQRIARWKIDGNKLVLVDEQGAALMRLMPETP